MKELEEQFQENMMLNIENEHRKFWTYGIDKNEVLIIKWGKIGTKGQEQRVKDLYIASLLEEALNKREHKLKEGYQKVSPNVILKLFEEAGE